jgi:cytochrome c-type biogenesis protein CcmE
MDRKRLKFVLLGLGVAATMVFLIIVAIAKPGGGMAYYRTVGEYLAEPAASGSFRVNGKVLEGSIQRLPTGQDVFFTMHDTVNASQVLRVEYRGIIPDTFVDKADVVVEGRMRPDGVFEASTLLAKCPSKYESADGQKAPQGA